MQNQFTQGTVTFSLLIICFSLLVLRNDLIAQELSLAVDTGHGSNITSIWLSRNGETLISQSSDRIILWDLKTNSMLRAIENESTSGLSPDGNILATYKEGYSFWDVNTGKRLNRFEGEQKCNFSPNPEQVGCAGKDGVLRIRKIVTGEILYELKSPGSPIINFAFGIDGSIITDRIIDKKKLLNALPELSKGKKKSSKDLAIGLFSVLIGVVTIHKKDQPAFSVGMVFSWDVTPEGNLLFVLDMAGNLKIIDIAKNNKVVFLEKNITTIEHVGRDGKYVAARRKDGNFVVWEVSTHRIIFSKPLPVKSGNNLISSPYGNYFAWVEKERIGVFDRDQKKEIFYATPPKPEDSDVYKTLQFSPNNRTLAANGSRAVWLWDIRSGKQIFSLAGGLVGNPVFSQDGKKFAVDFNSGNTNDPDKSLYIVDTESGQQKKIPLSSRLASASTEKTERHDRFMFLDREKDKNADQRDEVLLAGSNLIFSSDGGEIAFSSADRTINFTNTVNGKITRTLRPRAFEFEKVVFDSDRKTIEIFKQSEGFGERPPDKSWDFQEGKFVDPPAPKKIAAGDEQKTPEDIPKVEEKPADTEFEKKDEPDGQSDPKEPDELPNKASDSKFDIDLLNDNTLTVKNIDTGTVILTAKDVGGYETSDHGNFLLLKRSQKPGDKLEPWAENFSLEVWDLKNSRLILSQKDVDGYEISEEKNAVVLTRYEKDYDGTVMEGEKRRSFEVWDLRSSKVVLSQKGVYRFSDLEGGYPLILESDVLILESSEKEFDETVPDYEREKSINIWDLRTLTAPLTQKGVTEFYLLDDKQIMTLKGPHFTNGVSAAIDEESYSFAVWDLKNLKVILTKDKIREEISPDETVLILSSDSRLYDKSVPVYERQRSIEVWDLRNRRLSLMERDVHEFIFSGDKNLMILEKYELPRTGSVLEDETRHILELWDLKNLKVVFKLPKVLTYDTVGGDFRNIVIERFISNKQKTANSTTAAINKNLEIWDSKGQKIFSSPDGLIDYIRDSECNNLLLHYEKRLELHDLKNKIKKETPFDGSLKSYSGDLLISRNSKLVGLTDKSKTLTFWNTGSNKMFTSAYHSAGINGIDFSPNENYIITNSKDGSIKILKAEGGSLILTLVLLDENDWVVFDPKGRFDTNKPLDQIDGLRWELQDKLSTRLPLEIFLRQYFEPGLWRRTLKCNEGKNCDDEFKPLPNVADINRLQPRVAKPVATQQIPGRP